MFVCSFLVVLFLYLFNALSFYLTITFHCKESDNDDNNSTDLLSKLIITTIPLYFYYPIPSHSNYPIPSHSYYDRPIHSSFNLYNIRRIFRFLYSFYNQFFLPYILSPIFSILSEILNIFNNSDSDFDSR